MFVVLKVGDANSISDFTMDIVFIKSSMLEYVFVTVVVQSDSVISNESQDVALGSWTHNVICSQVLSESGVEKDLVIVAYQNHPAGFISKETS